MNANASISLAKKSSPLLSMTSRGDHNSNKGKYLGLCKNRSPRFTLASLYSILSLLLPLSRPILIRYFVITLLLYCA
jgi:hypothetical protein